MPKAWAARAIVYKETRVRELFDWTCGHCGLHGEKEFPNTYPVREKDKWPWPSWALVPMTERGWNEYNPAEDKLRQFGAYGDDWLLDNLEMLCLRCYGRWWDEYWGYTERRRVPLDVPRTANNKIPHRRNDYGRQSGG